MIIYSLRLQYLLFLFVITKSNWKSSVTAILDIYDVNNTTPLYNIPVLMYNIKHSLYIRAQERRTQKDVTEYIRITLIMFIYVIVLRDDKRISLRREPDRLTRLTSYTRPIA